MKGDDAVGTLDITINQTYHDAWRANSFPTAGLIPVERLIIRHLVNFFDLLLSSSEPLGVMRRQASRVYQSLG